MLFGTASRSSFPLRPIGRSIVYPVAEDPGKLAALGTAATLSEAARKGLAN